jgi:hypothetical protein
MIQRIQSLFLLAASLAAFATLKLSFYSGHKLNDVQKQYISLSGASSIPLIIITVAVAIASLVAIFLYKDRKMQIRICIAILIVSLLNLGLYFLGVQKFVPAESSFDLTCIFAFVIPVFLFLACRGIYKDQKLIKSVDRLR